MAMNGLGKKWLSTQTARFVCLAVLPGGLLLLSGCSWMIEISQNMRLRGYDNDVNSATQAIARARDGIERAKAYSTRGSAYAEKARYSRAFKLISTDEYQRLFDLAMKDHDQAIALNPNNAEAYYNRGKAYWDRGTAEEAEHKDFKASFDRAAADFEISTERDPQNFMAFDMLGLSREENHEWDEAIQDYSRELALNPKLGTMRLADAYCGRGQEDQRKMDPEPPRWIMRSRLSLGPRPTMGVRANLTIRCSWFIRRRSNMTRPGNSSTGPRNRTTGSTASW